MERSAGRVTGRGLGKALGRGRSAVLAVKVKPETDMEPFRYHVFVCDQHKPEGIPCCSARGSAAILDTLCREIVACGLDDEVQITTCGSLGLCEHGPNMVVYPDGIWYSGLTPADAAEIVRSHFRDDTPVERLVRADPASLRAEILTNRARFRQAQRAREGLLPDELQERIRAFQESRVMLTALELDAFTAVSGGATAEAVAAKLATDPRATAMLLNALTAFGLMTKAGDSFRNTPVAERHLTATSPNSSRMALLHMSSLWARWSHMTECVRSGAPADRADSQGGADTWTEPFIAAMHRNASERAAPVVQTVDGSLARRMLDVGGGSGAYSIAFAKANPALSADILDLATVLPIAQRHIQEAGVADRVHVRAGDLRADDLGSGYDLVFVSAICHMLGPEENRDLLARCFAALGSGGRVVVQDFVLEPDRTAPRFAALFALNMLVGTLSGNTYTEDDYADWLHSAGFHDVRRVRMPGTAHLMIASRP